LWIGTNYGFNQLDNTTNIFINYTSENGLRSNLIKGIPWMISGNLWISTMGDYLSLIRIQEILLTSLLKMGFRGMSLTRVRVLKVVAGS
jgi:ligand-binding sensor domain-containing protein